MNYMRSQGRGIAEMIPATSLRDIAEIAFRHRFGALMIVVSSILCAAGYAYLIRGDAFMAEAKLLVRLGQEQAPAPTMIADRSVFFGNQVGIANGEIELLHSRDLISELVDHIDLVGAPRPPSTGLFGRAKDWVRDSWHALRDRFDDAMIAAGLKMALTPREQAIEAISRSLLVETPPNSNVISVRMIWPERGAPEAILQSLLDLYFQRRVQLFQGSTATRFFSERRDGTAATLRAAETALADFEQAHQIANPEEQRSSLLKRLSDAEASVDAARLDLEAAETSLRQLQTAQPITGPATPDAAGGVAGSSDVPGLSIAQAGSPALQAIASDLANAVARWLAAQTTLGPRDASVQRQRAEIIALSRLLRQQTQATVSQRREQLALRIAQRDAIRDELSSLQASLTHWQELKRDVASALRAYEFNDGKLNEAIGVAALEQARIGNVTVVQRPAEQALPIGVRKSSLLILASAAGVLLALTWIVLREFFDHRLYNVGDVERRTGLRVLAPVPADRRGFTGRAAFAPATEAALARAAAGLVRQLPSAPTPPNSPSNGPTGAQAIAVIAADLGEGATSIAVHLGHHLVTLLGLRVLLVDASRPTVRATRLTAVANRLREPPRAVGLDDVATSEAPRWATVDLGQADGPMAPRLNGLLDAARTRFDVVLVDTAPFPNSVETVLASRACGQVLLVLGAGNLPSESIERVRNDLAEERIGLVGTVLNRTRETLPRWLSQALR